MIARSERSCPEVIEALVARWNEISRIPYRAVTFEARDSTDRVIYHTDCMLSLLGHHAFVCLDAIKDEKEKQEVIEVLKPLTPIELSHT